MFKELLKIKMDFNGYIKGLIFYKVIFVLLFSHTFHLLLLYRIGKAFSFIPIVGIPIRYLFEYLIRILFSSDISLKSTIQGGLRFEHGHDIVIGADVFIGNNCKIFNGVTIGNKNPDLSSLGNQPKIGNNVILSTGSKILGNINIGNNVIVGANSVVLIDIPDNKKAVGIPCRILD